MIARCVVSTYLDSTEPSDAIQITPHYRLTDGAEPAVTTFATALMNAWNGFLPVAVRNGWIKVAVYDAQKTTKPNYPITEVEMRKDTFATSTANRETALTLSYYASFNRPRSRGRLYIPAFFSGFTPSGAQAALNMRQQISALGPILAGVTPSTADWVVYSRVNNEALSVTNTWVDDAWDTIRSRGKRATARTLGVITQ